jgi:hypothetical protein
MIFDIIVFLIIELFYNIIKNLILTLMYILMREIRQVDHIRVQQMSITPLTFL